MNRFEYAETCPSCAELGSVNEGTGKIFNLGFDLDTSTICCLSGHTFDRLPSDSVARNGDSDGGAPSDVMRIDETMPVLVEAIPAAIEDASGTSECRSLESDLVVEDAANAQNDSAALAQISKQLETAPVEVVIPVTRPRDPVVANGARLTNGDLAVAITIPEQWAQAVVAEAEIQGMTVSDYLSEQVAQYLADYWTANYTNSR